MNVYRIVVYLSKNFELCESSSLLTIDSCFNRYRYSIVRSLDFQNLPTPSSNLHIFEILRCIDKYYNDFSHRYVCRYLTFELYLNSNKKSINSNFTVKNKNYKYIVKIIINV